MEVKLLPFAAEQGRSSPAIPLRQRVGRCGPHPCPSSGSRPSPTPPSTGRGTAGRAAGLTAPGDALQGRQACFFSLLHPPPGSFAETITVLGLPAVLPLNLIADWSPPLQPRHEPALNVTN